MSSRTKNINWAAQLEQELTQNILPFWMTHAVDSINGGMHGAVTNDLRVASEVPRSSILSARVLWTFSAAYRAIGKTEYRAMADRAFRDLTTAFWDTEHDGVYWHVDRHGAVADDRKHHYAQAFAIYGLTEYFQAVGHPDALDRAKQLYELLEHHAYDSEHAGYFEGSSRGWEPLDDARLSDKDLDSPKSMNTMLHMLEAYTNLLRVWDDAGLRTRLAEMLWVFCERIIDPQTHHMRLFFDETWHVVDAGVSYGHDIEASWLLNEAAIELGSPEIVDRIEAIAQQMAAAVLRDGVAGDGSLFTEVSSDGILDRGKDWWPQAEAIVGFYNAYELSGKEAYAEAARNCWEYVRSAMVDTEHGDWVKRIDENGDVDPERYKSGPWECPYHHSRTCLEMIRRLASPAGGSS